MQKQPRYTVETSSLGSVEYTHTIEASNGLAAINQVELVVNPKLDRLYTYKITTILPRYIDKHER